MTKYSKEYINAVRKEYESTINMQSELINRFVEEKEQWKELSIDLVNKYMTTEEQAALVPALLSLIAKERAK